jgi:membrane protein YdbS with pleckstrin-like domain
MTSPSTKNHTAHDPPSGPAGSESAADAASRLRPPVDHADRAEQPLRRESEDWSGRTNWKHFIGTVLVWILLNTGAGILLAVMVRRAGWLSERTALVGIAVFLVVTTAELVGRRVVWRILQKRYRLTSERLFIESGVLSRTIDQTELIRVDDVRVHKSLLDRVFGLGTVEIMSTDATHGALRIEGIADSDRVAEAIRTHMRALRRKSLFVENL